jgi:hypothetical protein
MPLCGRDWQERKCDRHLIWEICPIHLVASAFICVHLWLQNSLISLARLGCGYATAVSNTDRARVLGDPRARGGVIGALQ